MSLSTLPDLVIERLRLECATFSNRVAGSATEARVSEQTELAVPHAFFTPAGCEPAEGMLSNFEQEIIVRFTIVVTVGNSDRLGPDGTTNFYAAAASVIRALVGWNPNSAVFGPVICEGIEDDFAFNPARFSGAVNFRTAIMTSNI